MSPFSLPLARTIAEFVKRGGRERERERERERDREKREKEKKEKERKRKKERERWMQFALASHFHKCNRRTKLWWNR
jgi:hypothetical protein